MDITIEALPAFKDNYIWMLSRPDSTKCVCVDPGDAAPVLEYLDANGKQLVGILITHHHWDHTGGLDELLAHSPIPVYGPAHDPVQHLSYRLKENDSITIAELGLTLNILDIPGHTAGHIAYYNGDVLFCGDTLFLAGCGRNFEGTHAELFASLEKLKHLPDQLQIYCAHEYTEANLAFARVVEPHNSHIKARYELVQKQRQTNQITIPATLAIEKSTNPFLRCDTEAVKASAEAHAEQKLATPVDVFQVIRRWKDAFKPQ